MFQQILKTLHTDSYYDNDQTVIYSSITKYYPGDISSRFPY